MIVGCGGIGGELARHLVASGIGRLILVDDDVVNRSNFNRQYLFTHADLGESKVKVARRVLLGINPDVAIETYPVRVREQADLAALRTDSPDVVACCADTPLDVIHALVARYSVAVGATFATAGVGIDEGSWGPIMLPTYYPTYDTWQHERSLPVLRGRLSPPQGSFGPTNSFIASALATDLIHFLAGGPVPSLHCRLFYNFQTHVVRRCPITLEPQS